MAEKDQENINIQAENNQLITITTRSGYIITLYTGDYTDKSISLEVEKIEHD